MPNNRDYSQPRPGKRIQRAPPGEGGGAARPGLVRGPKNTTWACLVWKGCRGDVITALSNVREEALRGEQTERPPQRGKGDLGSFWVIWEENPSGRVGKSQLCEWRLVGGFYQGLRGLARLGDMGGVIWGVPSPEIFEPTVPPQKFWGVNPTAMPTSSRTQPGIPESPGDREGEQGAAPGEPTS